MGNFTKLFVLVGFIGISLLSRAQVGINVDDPDTAAILHIQHDKKGVLFPAIENLADVGEVNGLFIFRTTDDKFYYYHEDSASWQCMNPLFADSTYNSTLDGNLNVKGNLTVEEESTINGYGTIPIGGIIMWSGEHDNIPDGWALCNGDLVEAVQTPDLRGRFVVGHSMGDGTSNDPRYNPYDSTNNAVSNAYQYVGIVGGDTTVTLNKTQIPAHDHNKGSLNITASGSHTHGYRKPGTGTGQIQFDEVGAGNSETIYHISATSESSTHTHSNSSFSGNTGKWGGVYHPEEYYIVGGSKCQYNTTKEGCNDLSPYLAPFSYVTADPCNGTFEPVAGTPEEGPPGFNLNCFINKPECKNEDYHPDAGDKIVTKDAYYTTDPVENRPPYYVIAFIIRVK